MNRILTLGGSSVVNVYYFYNSWNLVIIRNVHLRGRSGGDSSSYGVVVVSRGVGHLKALLRDLLLQRAPLRNTYMNGHYFEICDANKRIGFTIYFCYKKFRESWRTRSGIPAGRHYYMNGDSWRRWSSITRHDIIGLRFQVDDQTKTGKLEWTCWIPGLVNRLMERCKIPRVNHSFSEVFKFFAYTFWFYLFRHEWHWH